MSVNVPLDAPCVGGIVRERQYVGCYGFSAESLNLRASGGVFSIYGPDVKKFYGPLFALAVGALPSPRG